MFYNQYLISELFIKINNNNICLYSKLNNKFIKYLSINDFDYLNLNNIEIRY